ncbi:MAG: YtxH domain-containing protein [Prochlorothrix sp.]
MAPSRSKTSGTARFVGGMLVGTAIGTVVGWASTSRVGDATRRQVRRKMQQSIQDLTPVVDTVLEQVVETVDTVAQRYPNPVQRWTGPVGQHWDGLVVRCREAIAAGLEAGKRVQDQYREETETVAVAAYPSEDDGEGEDRSKEGPESARSADLAS